MDNLLEILVPLIFAAIYFFGNMLSGKKDEEDAPSGLPRQRSADEEDADAAERQRRIQDEIRRKIMERRRAAGGEPATTVLDEEVDGELRAHPPARFDRREAEALREVRQEKQESREAMREVQAPKSAYSKTSREKGSDSRRPSFSWDSPGNAYESQMEAKLRLIEETKRQAEKLRRQAARHNAASDAQDKQSKPRTGGYFTGSVRETLRNPRAARAAFIYGEVLGQPLSLRKGSGSVPGLS